MGVALPDHPAGLPIGAGWRTAVSTAPVFFPFDGSLVADAPVRTGRPAGLPSRN